MIWWAARNEEFNAAFRVDGTHNRFSYDVLTPRGHEVERYEHARTLWGVTETAVSVKIAVPTVGPVLMIAAKRIASERGRQPRFDAVYACGAPRPDFALNRTTACDLWRAVAVIAPGHETVWTRANR